MTVKPEKVGLSSARLDRIRGHFQRYIDDGKLAGTLTLVVRHGEIAFFEPQGHLELERRRPMQRDTVFRIYSMRQAHHHRSPHDAGRTGPVPARRPRTPVHPRLEGPCRCSSAGTYPTFVTAPAERPMAVRDLLNHTSGLTYGFMERTNVDAAYRSLRIARSKPARLHPPGHGGHPGGVAAGIFPRHALELFGRHGRRGLSGRGHLRPALRRLPAGAYF